MIDPGTSICTIRESVVLNDSIFMTPFKTKLMCFGNKEIISPGIVSQIITFENLKPREIELRVVPDTAQSYDVLLVRTFTEALDISYTRIGTELNFMNIDPDIFPDKNKKRSNLQIEHKEELHVDRVNFIKVKSDLEMLELPVSHHGDENIQIKKGQIIKENMFTIEEVPRQRGRKNQITKEEVNFDVHVTSEKKIELLKMLNKYRDYISSNIDDLRCTDKIEMKIELKDGSVPFHLKPYNLNAEDREDLDKIVDAYKKAGIVSETESERVSPVFLKRKKESTPRILSDYRRINKDTKVYNFPISNFDDLVEKVNKATIFIKLDLASGYLQMPLDRDSRDKTAFITETQTGQITRAMFGLVNAPMYFAKLMHKVLGNAQRKGIAIVFFMPFVCLQPHGLNY